MSAEPGVAAPGWTPDVLAGLRAELGDTDGSFVAELVRIYLADTPPRLHALVEAAATGDTAAVREAAHAVKGSTLAMGGTALAARCAELERDGRPGPDLLVAVVGLASEFDALAADLRGHLAGLAGPS